MSGMPSEEREALQSAFQRLESVEQHAMTYAQLYFVMINGKVEANSTEVTESDIEGLVAQSEAGLGLSALTDSTLMTIKPRNGEKPPTVKLRVDKFVEAKLAPDVAAKDANSHLRTAFARSNESSHASMSR